MDKSGFEIERKFLILMPEKERLLKESSRVLHLRQTYLLSPDNESARVRLMTETGNTSYIYTEKKKISPIKRMETEYEISLMEYEKQLEKADPNRSPIEKTRYCIPYCGHILEIDIFPFWQDKAFLEIELSSEEEAFSVPDWVVIIKEVTEDKRYTNASLAKELPE